MNCAACGRPKDYVGPWCDECAEAKRVERLLVIAQQRGEWRYHGMDEHRVRDGYYTRKELA